LQPVLDRLLEREGNFAFVNSWVTHSTGEDVGMSFIGGVSEPLQITFSPNYLTAENEAVLRSIVDAAALPFKKDIDIVYIHCGRDTAKAAHVAQQLYSELLHVPSELAIEIEEN
jgi:hypothetical protein